MKNRSAARKYAKVIMKIAPADEALNAFEAEAGRFSGLLQSSPSISRFFLKPLIGKSGKLQVIKSACAKLRISDRVERFLMVLIENERLDLLDAILESLQAMKDERKKIVTVEITTATALDAALREKLSALFASLTGRKVRIDARVDSAIIGGVVTKVGSTVYDGTVRTQLSRMKAEILGE